MSRMKLVSIATMLVLAMMLTACNGTPSQGDGNKPGSEQSELPSSSVKPSESDKPDSQLPSQSEDPSEPETQLPSQSEDPSESENPSEPLEDGWTRLTEDELKWFNEQFFNVDGNAIVNAFLNCTYTDVKDISMYDLFYDCPNQSEIEVTKAEKVLLEKKWEEIYTDIQKVPASYMDDMLSKYANIKLADSNKVELDMLVYLEDYDAYYSMHGDTHYTPVEVKSGVKDANGNVKLQYLYVEDELEYVVTLKAYENGYYFVSNVLAE